MTPEQIDHLRAIDAHLTALLDLAAKRTPGEWELLFDYDKSGWKAANPHRLKAAHSECQKDAAFIAACAGRAEAGWRATKNVIAAYWRSACDAEWHGYLGTAVEEILAAWPRELLTLP